jgi:hypothetical protein
MLNEGRIATDPPILAGIRMFLVLSLEKLRI